MAISVGSNGWSHALGYDTTWNDPTNDDAYHEVTNTQGTDGTWYARSWWSSNRWAKKYVNSTDAAIKLTELSFRCCPCHSGGQQFMAAGGSIMNSVNGYGCTFTLSLYTADESYDAASSASLPNIVDYNCSWGGIEGAVSVTDDLTSFGQLGVYGPGSTAYPEGKRSSNGEPLWRAYRDFTFSDAPTIEPGGYLYVHVVPTSWNSGSTSSNTALTLYTEGNEFQATFEPAETPYVWRMYEDGIWRKTHYLFVWDGTQWVKQVG